MCVHENTRIFSGDKNHGLENEIQYGSGVLEFHFVGAGSPRIQLAS